MYYRLKNSDFDFIKPRKKIIHEGLTLFRTNIWKKVFQLTKKKYQKEHPGYVVKEYSKKFNIKTYLPKKYEKEKKFRISVDTKSDFDFFNYLHNLLKRKKRKFNLINVIKIKKKNVLNKHVFQRVANPKKIPNIIIITTFSKSLGLGHMARSKVLLREIQETTQSIPKIFLLNSARSDDVMLKKNVFYIKKISRNLLKYADKVIIDLPEKVLSKEKKKLPDNSKIIIVDNYYKEFKKINFIIPSIKKYSIKKNNIYSGNDYLILSRDINYQNSINNKLLYKKLLVLSGSNNIDKKTYDLISKNKNIKILLGSLIKKKEYKKIKKITKNVILNPNNLFQIIKQSKIIYCKFGITALEVIALGKKPIIIDHFRNNQTVIDVNYLIKNNLVSPIDFKCHLTKKNNLKIDINKSLKNVMKLIVK